MHLNKFLYSVLCVVLISCSSNKVINPVVMEGKNTIGKIEIKKYIKIVNENQYYKTYRIKDYKNSEIIKYHIFYVDIPKKLHFSYYFYKEKKGTYVFSDNNNNIFFEINYGSNISVNQDCMGSNKKCGECFDFLSNKIKEEIKDDLFYGYVVRNRYLAYYYNIKKQDLNVYNKSIISVREDK